MQNEKGPLKYYGGSIMINLKDLTFEELQDFLIQMGEKPFRAKQIYTWLYRGVTSFEEMTDISKQLREKLSGVSYISEAKILQKLESKVDETKKYLFLCQSHPALQYQNSFLQNLNERKKAVHNSLLQIHQAETVFQGCP